MSCIKIDSGLACHPLHKLATVQPWLCYPSHTWTVVCLRCCSCTMGSCVPDAIPGVEMDLERTQCPQCCIWSSLLLCLSLKITSVIKS